MERCYIKIIIGWIGIFCLSIVPPQINAQDYRIAHIIPYLSDDSLKVDVTLDNILQDDILKTLLAGIPLDFKIQGSLLDDEQHSISQKVFNSKVSYDVWEEHFWILGFNEKLLDFDNLDGVKNWVSTNHTLALVEQNSLTPQNTYTVHITLQIIILGKQESQQLKWWIENSDQTEEDLASRERSTGFKLNLNQLVQMFFSREKAEDKYEISKISKPFTLSDLKFP